MVRLLHIFIHVFATAVSVHCVDPSQWAHNLTLALSEALEDVSHSGRHRMPSWVMETLPLDTLYSIKSAYLNTFSESQLHKRIDSAQSNARTLFRSLPKPLIDKLHVLERKLYEKPAKSQNKRKTISVLGRSAESFASLTSSLINDFVDEQEVNRIPMKFWKRLGPKKFNQLEAHILSNIPKSVFTTLGHGFLNRLSTEQLVRVKNILVEVDEDVPNLTKALPAQREKDSVERRLSVVMENINELMQHIPTDVLKVTPPPVYIKMAIEPLLAMRDQRKLQWDLVRELESGLSTLIGYLSPKDVQSLKWSTLAPLLEPAFFNGLPKTTVVKIPWNIVWNYVSVPTMYRLDAALFASLNPNDVSSLPVDKFSSLSESVLRSFTDSQLRAISPDRIHVLTHHQKQQIGLSRLQ